MFNSFRNEFRLLVTLLVVLASFVHNGSAAGGVDVAHEGHEDSADRVRRSPFYGSHFGKRITSSLVEQLGKRPKEMYSFGIGKRSISAEEMDEFMAEQEGSSKNHLDGVADQAAAAIHPSEDDHFFVKRDPYAFGLGKRDPYSFGLGKRGGQQYGFGLGKKRDPYAFGLGKRADHTYAFGMGKKDDPYAFGLGKRDPYAFGLGKRDPYAFGLGKRDPYAFGLGKRSDPYAFGLGKRDPYAFGLGKRSGGGDPYAFGLGRKRDPYSFGLGKRSV